MDAVHSSWLHPAWVPVVTELQRCGLLTGVDPTRAAELLEVDADQAPTPILIASLVRRHYAISGDPIEALWRRQQDRYVELSPSQSPESMAEAMGHTIPALEQLRAALTPRALVVSLWGEQVSVSRLVRHTRVRHRQRRVPVAEARHLARAVNALLARTTAPWRLVELYSEPGRHAYVATDEPRARALFHQQVTAHPRIADMLAFAAWMPMEHRRAG